MLMQSLPFVALFLLTVASDYAWTRYIAKAAEKQAHAAARWSVAIVGCSAFSVMSYTQDHRLIVPVLLGAYAGTWLAVWRDRPVNTKEDVIALIPVTLAPALTHWSKDPEVPYHNCTCGTCYDARAVTIPAPVRAPCNHKHCTVMAEDYGAGTVRWSCGAIEQ